MTVRTPESPPIRIVQAGMGGWGRGWMDVVASETAVEPVGYVDPSAAARNAILATGAPESSVFGSLEDAIRATRPDAALVTSAVDTHARIALEAIASGLHVLLEKPFAATLGEAVDVVEAAERAGRVLMVSQNYRHQPAPRVVARLVAEGAVGEVRGVEIDFRRPRTRRRDWLEIHQRVPQPLLADMSIHHFDLLRLVLDRDPAWVEIEPLTGNWGGYRDPPAAFGLLGFDGGVVVSYRGSWISEGRRTPWGGEWRMEGTAGAVEWASRGDPGVSDRVRLRQADGGWQMLELPPIPKLDRAGTLAAFADAIRMGAEPETSGRRNLATLALTHAAVRSAGERRRVEIAELLGEHENMTR